MASMLFLTIMLPAQIPNRGSRQLDSARVDGQLSDTISTNADEQANFEDSSERAPQDEEKGEAALSLELSGFIVDETQTKLGRDFYENFYALWNPPPGMTEFTIVISEKPLPQRGTQVSMTVNDFTIFQVFLQPRLEAIEEMAYSAVDRAISFLRNYQEAIQELEGDDMAGSGIF
ncbi:MAG: hypothetical protein IH600_16520 [Bacteroidetes bacterium]|nr:hypothetical protein [Bacteroidota bacterium]